MIVHLIDGTYELFRHFFPLPSHRNAVGEEVAATRGVLGSLVGLLEEGATHVGVATDHVIESFRNDLWPGYKTSAGMEPEILSQFPILEETMVAAGFELWAMEEYEADDALAAAASLAATDREVERVLICTADKDLAQCVSDPKIAQFDRRKGAVLDEAGVREKFGVEPESIPDYLGLVGDSADGFPGLPGWGAKSASTLLARYRHLEDIPDAPGKWEVTVRGAPSLAATLASQRDLAYLFRRIATLELDAPVSATVEDIRWTGPSDAVAEACDRLDAPNLTRRLQSLAEGRGFS